MTEHLGRYRLLKLLATGGMGEVFLALQEGPANFSKTVVIKRILRHLASDQSFIDLFLNEARLAALLQHPNIVQVFGLEHEDNAWFIAMEHVHGRSLRDVISAAKDKGLKIPPRIAARLAAQALQGLQHAHELTDSRGQPLGILHRDISPENVLVSFSGDVKLVDFGLAKAMSGTVAHVGRPRGKLAYMAPELTVPGAQIDRRSDIYAMGVLLVEALTLEVPLNTPKTVEEAQGPRPSWEPDPSIPPGLAAVIARAVSIQTRHRFEDAAQMASALEAWISASAQPVVPGDIIIFLEALFGADALDFNSGVMLGSDALTTTGLHSRRHGTEPLSQPLTAQNKRTAERLAAVPTPEGNYGWPIAIGVITASVIIFVVVLGVWPQPFSPSPEPPQVKVIVAEPTGPSQVAVLEPVKPPEPVDAGLPAQNPEPPTVIIPPIEITLDDPGEEPPKKTPRGKKKLGRVSVKATPWAEVIFAGRSLGRTPMAPVSVPAGIARFTLRNSKLGVTRKVTVKVPAGGLVTVRVDMTRK